MLLRYKVLGPVGKAEDEFGILWLSRSSRIFSSARWVSAACSFHIRFLLFPPSYPLINVWAATLDNIYWCGSTIFSLLTLASSSLHIPHSCCVTWFFAFYATEFNPSFYDTLIQELNVDMSPGLLIFAVAILGMATTLIATLTLMQLFKPSNNLS